MADKCPLYRVSTCLAESAFRYLLIISGPHAQVRTVLEFPITRNKGRSLIRCISGDNKPPTTSIISGTEVGINKDRRPN